MKIKKKLCRLDLFYCFNFFVVVVCHIFFMAGLIHTNLSPFFSHQAKSIIKKLIDDTINEMENWRVVGCIFEIQKYEVWHQVWYHSIVVCIVVLMWVMYSCITCSYLKGRALFYLFFLILFVRST